MIKYSIVVPIYNVENFLKRCVDSIINQTYSNLEIILIDDGSPDMCPQICDEYSLNDNRVRVIHKKNGGLSDSRNVGLRNATGEYILFVDSDDWLKENAIENFDFFLNKNRNVDIAIGCLINEDGTLYTKHSKAVIGKVYSGKEYFVKFQDYIYACAVAPMYRRDFLIDNGLSFVVNRYHEDNDFTPRVYIAAKKVIYTENDFYVRYIRDDSITQHKDKRKNLLDMLFISRELYKYSQEIAEIDVRKLLLDRICNGYLSMFYETDIYRYKEKEKRKYIDKKLVRRTAQSPYNKLRAYLYTVSPRLYLLVNKTTKKYGNNK